MICMSAKLFVEDTRFFSPTSLFIVPTFNALSYELAKLKQVPLSLPAL